MRALKAGPLFFCLILAACGNSKPSLPGAKLFSAPAESRVEGRFVVVLQPGTSVGDFVQSLREIPAGAPHVVRTFRSVFAGVEVEADQRQVHALVALPNVVAVHEVRKVSALGSSRTQQKPWWNLDRIDQKSFPLDGRYRYRADGSGVHVYIVDSGVMGSLPEFEGRVETGADVSEDVPGNLNKDCSGHGTHVAGLAGGRAFGVAKGVSLVPVKVFACNHYGSDAVVAAGLDWVLAHAKKPAVVNLSLGSAGDVPLLREAVQRLLDAGITVVAAAGNDGADACGVTPARIPGVITVGGTSYVRDGERRLDGLYSMTNHGPCVDLFAPGENIRSVFPFTGDNVEVLSGTSMAAPQATGAAALFLSEHPLATPDEVSGFLKETALSGVLPLGDDKPDTPNLFLNVGWNDEAAIR